MTTTAAALPALDDLSVLQRYASTGDPRAFEELLARYHAMVRATCARALVSPADADDAVQETFLKFARHARRIRSNAAAWLHACALRTAIDLVRARAARARAEAAAPPIDSTDDPAERTWRETKPLLDAALAALDERDRDLIVQRFLMGRTEAEIARAVAVHPGTINRRLDRALAKLRAQLTASGLGLAAAVPLTAVLVHAAPAPAAVPAALMEIGLAGMATCGTPAALSAGKLVLLALLGTVTLGSIISGSVLLLTPAAPPKTAAAAPAPLKAPPRPTADLGPFPLTSIIWENRPPATITCTGDTLRVDLVASPEDRLLPGQKPEDSVLKLRIESIDRTKTPPVLALRLESTTGPRLVDFENMLGKLMPTTMEIKDDRVELNAGPGGPNEPSLGLWRGTRAPVPKPGPSAGLKPESQPADQSKTAQALAPELQGAWQVLPEWKLTLGAEEIRIMDRGFEVYRFKILEWDSTGPEAKIQALCLRSRNEGTWIGARVKLLLRQADGVYTLVHHEPSSTARNEWPKTATPKAGDRLRALVWKQEAAR